MGSKEGLSEEQRAHDQIDAHPLWEQQKIHHRPPLNWRRSRIYLPGRCGRKGKWHGINPALMKGDKPSSLCPPGTYLRVRDLESNKQSIEQATGIRYPMQPKSAQSLMGWFGKQLWPFATSRHSRNKHWIAWIRDIARKALGCNPQGVPPRERQHREAIALISR